MTDDEERTDRFISTGEVVRMPDWFYEREERVDEAIVDLEEGRDPGERDV